MASLFQKAGRILANGSKICILSGAGISAESGIPTFRGEGGYWKIGSTNYRPESLATWEFFSKNPADCWHWYLYRKKVCNEAAPNKGHEAVVKLDLLAKKTKRELHLITQNVDGLHARAESSPETTFEIHGNIDKMRCASSCTTELFQIPEDAIKAVEDRGVDPLQHCPLCAKLARPHVLFFDECYNEEWFKVDSSVAVAGKMDVLVVIGTSLATTLPSRIVSLARSRAVPIININPFETISGAVNFELPSGEVLPLLAEFVEKEWEKQEEEEATTM